MTYFRRFCRYASLILLGSALLLPVAAFAACTEFKIVELEDRVEAVCVGEPLTEAQLKAKAEEEKREAESQRQKAAEEKRQKDRELASTQNKAKDDAARKQDARPVAPVRAKDKSGYR